MELLQEGILHLEKQLKGIAFDLNMVKAMNMVLWFIAIALVATCSGLLVYSIAMQSIEASIAIYIITCGLIGFLWITLPDVIDYYKTEIAKLKSEKFKCETEIEKAKQVFKWLVVTEDGEVVVSDLKPDYDEEFDVWFFSCEAKTVQVGSNKKLAKHSKHTLTKIK